MSAATQPRSMGRKLVHLLLLVLKAAGFLLLAVCVAVALLSLPRQEIDAIYIGQILIEFAGSYIFLILLAGTIMAAVRWKRTRCPWALAVAGIAGIAALAYTGGSPGDYPARYAAVSPMTHVREAAPPTLILSGLDDNLVPVEDTLKFVNIARAAGNKVDLITIPRAGHGFDIVPGSIGNQIFRKGTLQFLRRHDLQP